MKIKIPFMETETASHFSTISPHKNLIQFTMTQFHLSASIILVAKLSAESLK